MWKKTQDWIRRTAVCGTALASAAAAEPIDCGTEDLHAAHSLGFAVAQNGIPATGEQTLLFIRVRFAGDAQDPVDLAQAESDLAATRQVFEEVSYGKLSLASTITPVLMLERSAAEYETRGFSGLVADSREAALSAGFNYLDYDLDIVRHNPVPGFRGGYGNIGLRGATVQSSGVPIIAHELGHNLGLHHANSWTTEGPDSSPKVSPPFPSNVEEGKEGHPFDPDSFAGHHSMNGPGKTIEYGDSYSVMGSGDPVDGRAQFNAPHKYAIGWLNDATVKRVEESGVYRLFNLAGGDSPTESIRGIRIAAESMQGDSSRDYWLQFAPDLTFSAWPDRGVFVIFVPPSGEANWTQLLDATPNTTRSVYDAPIPLGKTLHDPDRGLRLTPLATGGEGAEHWIDVRIQFGTPLENQSPSLDWTPSNSNAEPNELAQLTAQAADADGDELAYHWDFGDGTIGGNSPQVSKAWGERGEYVVRCEVSDGKGGVASKHRVIRVGSPDTFRISGRVLDDEGAPVSGARVQNGYWIKGEGTPSYVWTETDSDGAYSLTGLPNANYFVGAYRYGYRSEASGWSQPLALNGSDAANIDFIARRIPTITVAPREAAVSEGGTAEFVFTRSGPLDQQLTVSFGLGGTAWGSRDYASPILSRLIFPVGGATASVPLPLFQDGKAEADESITVSLETSSSYTREVTIDGKTELATFYYPGWELRDLGGQNHWFQTDPEFVVTAASRSEIQILDIESREPFDFSFELRATSVGSFEIHAKGQAGRVFELERSTDLASWEAAGAHVFFSESQVVPLEEPASPSVFYRGRLNGFEELIVIPFTR